MIITGSKANRQTRNMPWHALPNISKTARVKLRTAFESVVDIYEVGGGGGGGGY